MTEQNLDSFISIADAIQQAKKSDATIRRMIKELTPQDRERFTKTVKGKIFVSKTLFDISEPIEPTTPKTSQNEDITFLKEQIEIKDRQIDSLNKVVESLSERQRETNILFGNAINRLQLSEAKQPQEQEPQSNKKPPINAYLVPILCIVILLTLCVIIYQSMIK